MNTKVNDILVKLTSLQKKEFEMQCDIKRHFKVPGSMEKVRVRIRHENQLKSLREEIEQEEYNLEEARILQSLRAS